MKKIALLFIVLAFACAKNPIEPPPPPSPDVNGTWQGADTVNNIPFTFTVTLEQADSTVKGNGEFSALGFSIPFTVIGSCVYPNVNLSFANPESTFVGTYIGTFSEADDNKIDGLANVPAVPIRNQSLLITRTK